LPLPDRPIIYVDPFHVSAGCRQFRIIRVMLKKYEQFQLRDWQRSDIDALVKYADNRKIWLNLRDVFPHPYTRKDAEAWLGITGERYPGTHFAIVIDGEAAGGISLIPKSDVYHRTAEIGYWLGEPFWGRGIVTTAVKAVTEWGFSTFDLCRIEAGVFGHNMASMRVLEKAGYVREGVLRKSITKDGTTMDSVLYAKIREQES